MPAQANILKVNGEVNAHISEKFKGSRQRRPATTSSAFTESYDINLNKDIRQYIHDQEKKNKSVGNGDWRGRPEIPTNDEVSLAVKEEVTLIPNKIRGKWKTKDKYLRAHYELHREDAVSPLRDAVDKFRKCPDMNDDHTLHIYEKVHICGFTFSQLGIAARIQFSTNRAGRHILWQSSKRLVSGTLVALTPSDNNFESKCIVALVAARALVGLELNPPQVDIFFCRSEDIQIDPQQEWIMVEAKQGYFEAYRHTLKALQKQSHESFPLSSQICSLDPDIEPPTYLKNNPSMSLSPATAEGQDESYGVFDVLKDWPDHTLSSLDKSQWSALEQVLTRSLAVIQGPPGTGKTYCSRVALEVLHGYLSEDDPPIIIAAQTNHALDQLLSHVSNFEPNFIRLGGRSTSPEIKKRALFEIRRKERLPPIPGGLLGRATTNWTLQAKKMVELLAPLHEATKEPLSIDTLVKHGIITQKQCESLRAASERWISSDGVKVEPLQLWLDKALVPFEVDYRLDYFGLNEEDEDLEVEQLREHEAEHGVNDEEDAELLKGPWCFVQDNWTTTDSVETDLEKAAGLLDTEQDLYHKRVLEYLRGPMYKIMQQRLKAILQVKFRQLASVYDQNLKDLKIGKWERDAVFLRRARIIGLTTTGLSKYRPLIASLRPKIILIEEAAEVLEAPVAVVCMDSIEHLILVGDHQQLQGHCSVPELEGEPYYLNVSLFERLVRNNIPYKALLQQRRMDPSFRKLIQTLYPDLDDHSSVSLREVPSWGMGNVRSFFFSHDWSEYRDSQMSTYNPEEAKFIAGFYRHLVQNCVPSSAVTILTFYNGQRKRLLKEIRAFSDLRDSYNIVKTVDSYQGEENDIVLLSLARSNTEGKIGFLEISNRVCVALSRAKLGFYMFGNSNLLANRSELWGNVIGEMAESNRLANQQLPTYCERHLVTTIVEYPDDWSKYDGGCANDCASSLPCGHKCLLKCHPFPHDRVFCGQACKRTLACGHECQNRCSEVCSCNCPDSAEAEHEVGESSPAYRNGQIDVSSHIYGIGQSYDVRINHSQVVKSNPGMDGRYASGQQACHSPSRSAFHLPEQVPTLIDLNEIGVVEQAQPGMPMVSRKNILAGSGLGSFLISRTSPSVSQERLETVETCRLSPEEQAWSRKGWSNFAAGGVKKDDERRDLSDNMPRPNMRTKEWPTLGKAVRERKQTMVGGRAKFTETCEPAAAKQYPTRKYGSQVM